MNVCEDVKKGRISMQFCISQLPLFPWKKLMIASDCIDSDRNQFPDYILSF